MPTSPRHLIETLKVPAGTAVFIDAPTDEHELHIVDARYGIEDCRSKLRDLISQTGNNRKLFIASSDDNFDVLCGSSPNPAATNKRELVIKYSFHYSNETRLAKEKEIVELVSKLKTAREDLRNIEDNIASNAVVYNTVIFSRRYILEIFLILVTMLDFITDCLFALDAHNYVNNHEENRGHIHVLYVLTIFFIVLPVIGNYFSLVYALMRTEVDRANFVLIALRFTQVVALYVISALLYVVCLLLVMILPATFFLVVNGLVVGIFLVLFFSFTLLTLTGVVFGCIKNEEDYTSPGFEKECEWIFDCSVGMACASAVLSSLETFLASVDATGKSSQEDSIIIANKMAATYRTFLGPFFALCIRAKIGLGFYTVLEACSYMHAIKSFADVSFRPTFPIRSDDSQQWSEVFTGAGMSLWFANEEDSSDRRTAITPVFWFLFPAHVVVWFLTKNLLDFLCTTVFLFENFCVLLISMTNSELIFHLFADTGSNPMITSLISITLEDLPQLIIQIVYAVYVGRVNPLQVFSFIFTFWRMGYTVALRVSSIYSRDPVQDRPNPIASGSEHFDFTLGIITGIAVA